jgi:opacity protein-like surface antigen
MKLVGVIAGLAVFFTLTGAARAEDGNSFDAGTWTLQFSAAYFDDLSPSDENVATGTTAVGYYFADRWALNLEVVGYALDAKQGGDDTQGAGVNLGLRWHFIAQDRVSLFLEGAAGMLYADERFPPGGTNFNFALQAGLGATFRVYENVHLIGAARYLHISNANLHGIDENPSIDSIGGYVGVLFEF